ncbi:MAG: SEC-C metal-binding domain-containing protein [Oscillospiraceae bacterium]|nr:SEC-C metal-binding domain-containing protein [Oscillospiraceae bacterium]
MTYIIAHYCANPYCPCKTVTLNFFDANSKSYSRLFELVVNYETWQLESSQIFNSQMNCEEMIDEFMTSIDDQFKADILSEIKPKAKKEHPLRNDIELFDFGADSMIFYSDIYQTEPYETLLFTYGGKRYFVLDHYCPKPKCDCKDALFAFYEINDDGGKAEITMDYKVNYETGVGTVEEMNDGISLRFARELYEEFCMIYGGDAMSLFKNRHREIKRWGAKYFGAGGLLVAAISQKTGRNAPCPCGSGKKYKKCCGS